MIRNQWYAVSTVRSVGRRPLAVRRFGRDLVLWRGGDDGVVCMVDACCHRGAALSRGRVVAGCLECPYHGLRFDGSGRCVAVPAHPHDPVPPAMRLRPLPCRLARGLVWVWHGDASDALPDLPWDDAFEADLRQDGGGFVTLQDTFDVSYLRVMENLCDFHHVAHVHRRTAPAPAEVTRLEARRDGVHVHVHGHLGAPGARRSFAASTHIVAPCVAQLHFEGLARFAVVATPVDATHVWLFVRYTQTFARIWGLTRLLTWLLGMFDYRLLQRWEDLPVWRSQRLVRPDDVSRYTWLPADAGIALYFDAHRELGA